MGSGTGLTAMDPRFQDEILFANLHLSKNRMVDLTNLIVITLLHCVALLGPWYYSTDCLLLFAGLYLFTGLGITLGYHRMVSHRSLVMHPIPKFIIHLAGCLSLQGPPLHWALVHRIHHARSDKPGDPHSPRDGMLWSHIVWLFAHREGPVHQKLQAKYLPDLNKDKLCNFFEKTYVLWNLLLAGVLFYTGGLAYLIWGMAVRIVFNYHMTWFVNSATHVWGYRNFETSDHSRNLWWVALLTLGEGWHNNHHAQPAAALNSCRWWELDPTGWTIRMLRMTRLASKVVVRKPMSRYEVEMTTEEPEGNLLPVGSGAECPTTM